MWDYLRTEAVSVAVDASTESLPGKDALEPSISDGGSGESAIGWT